MRCRVASFGSPRWPLAPLPSGRRAEVILTFAASLPPGRRVGFRVDSGWHDNSGLLSHQPCRLCVSLPSGRLRWVIVALPRRFLRVAALAFDAASFGSPRGLIVAFATPLPSGRRVDHRPTPSNFFRSTVSSVFGLCQSLTRSLGSLLLVSVTDPFIRVTTALGSLPTPSALPLSTHLVTARTFCSHPSTTRYSAPAGVFILM